DAPPGQDGRGGRQHRDQRHGVAWRQQRDQQRDGKDGKAKARHALEGGREKDHARDEQPLCHATPMETLVRGDDLGMTPWQSGASQETYHWSAAATRDRPCSFPVSYRYASRLTRAGPHNGDTATAMCVWPAHRISPMTVCRTAAITCGIEPHCTGDRS